MPAGDIKTSERWVDPLERELGANWTLIRKARHTTEQKRAMLRDAFQGKIAPDTSLVVFGSVAREEMTSVVHEIGGEE